MNYSMNKTKIREVLTETVGILYLLNFTMVVYATGAVAMYNTPVPSWYYVATLFAFGVPVAIGIGFVGVVITKAVHRAKKPVRYGVIPSRVIVRALKK